MVILDTVITESMVWGSFISYLIAFAIPMILVAYGGMFSEHSGIVNIALEGIMVMGAMIAALTTNALNSLVLNKEMADWVALTISVFAAGVGGVVFSFLLSFAANKLNADQTIAGTAMNIMAPAIFILGATALNKGVEVEWIYWPDWLKISPDVFGIGGTSFWRSLSINTLGLITTYFAAVLIPLSAFILYRTKFGLRLRSCGEHPEASASLGINVIQYRYIGVAISGFLGGIGGAAYTMASTNTVYGDVYGLGFLSLAVMIFGNWNAGKIILAGLFFSFFRTLSSMTTTMKMSSNSFISSIASIPNSGPIFSMLPYIVTLIVLIFTSAKSQAPKAEGTPFDVAKRS
jgi:ABC-type uncharacterized transport system permease subunit